MKEQHDPYWPEKRLVCQDSGCDDYCEYEGEDRKRAAGKA